MKQYSESDLSEVLAAGRPWASGQRPGLSVMFLGIEVYLKSPPSSHLNFRTLSSSSIRLQWSNCRKLSTESDFPLFSYSPFYDLHFVKCSLCLSQDPLVTVCVCSSLLWLHSCVWSRGLASDRACSSCWHTARTEICHKFLLIGTEKGPSLWGRDRKTGNN